MELNKWPQQQPPNPNPHYPSQQFTYYPLQSQNPNAETQEFPATTALVTPGNDSYASLSSYPHGNGAYDSHAQVSVTYDPNQTADVAAQYSDLNAHNSAIKEAIRLYGVDPAAYAGTGVFIASNCITQLSNANPSPTQWVNPNALPHLKHNWKKRPRKTKILQSAYCEICQIDCSSKDVLDQHKLGKKHKKNLEKLQEATLVPPGASAGSSNPVIGPQENPSKGKTIDEQRQMLIQKKHEQLLRKAAQPEEFLETKRRKVVESGAAAEAVRICTICKVVCNSDTVFNYHLAGGKHAIMVKKYAAGTI